MGVFTRENLRAVLAEVCAQVGLDDRDARLLRVINNAVYLLEREQVVVRIVTSVALRHRVHKVVRVASWFEEHDVPAVRLHPGLPQPVRVGDHLATIWTAVPDTGHTPRPRDLARLLRHVHSLPLPPFPMPAWDPLDDVRRRIGEAVWLDDDDRSLLLDRCASVELRLAELDYQLPPGLVHGDAHLGNVIPGPAGPVLCDFDSASVGPPEWDLTPYAVAVRRFGEPAHRYRALARAYGLDVTRWSGFEVLREVRELKLITSVLPIAQSNPDVRPELHRRLHDFRTGNTTALWSKYA